MVSRAQAEREIREMEKRALDDLIDRKLILTEFERLGGVITGGMWTSRSPVLCRIVLMETAINS